MSTIAVLLAEFRATRERERLYGEGPTMKLNGSINADTMGTPTVTCEGVVKALHLLGGLSTIIVEMGNCLREMEFVVATPDASRFYIGQPVDVVLKPAAVREFA